MKFIGWLHKYSLKYINIKKDGTVHFGNRGNINIIDKPVFGENNMVKVIVEIINEI